MAAHAALTPIELRQELSRLEGHEVVVNADGSSYHIVNAAAEGPAMIGLIEARGQKLWFIKDNRHSQQSQQSQSQQVRIRRHGRSQWRLRGRLAIPRIAGPGYKVWIVGEIRAGALWVRRLGILRSPYR